MRSHSLPQFLYFLRVGANSFNTGITHGVLSTQFFHRYGWLKKFFCVGRSQELENGETIKVISERSQVIVTYALCGFSNISSIVVQIVGIVGIIAIAPSRETT